MIRREYLRAHNTINAGKGFASFAWDYNDFTELFVRTCRLALKAATKVSKKNGSGCFANKVMEANELNGRPFGNGQKGNGEPSFGRA